MTKQTLGPENGRILVSKPEYLTVDEARRSVGMPPYEPEPIRLDLGAGEASPPGFRPMGRDHGSEIFPLPYPDESVDEIRACHVLEHFSYVKSPNVHDVLKDWCRALKKGGRLRISVPDFEKVAQGYLAGKNQPTQGYLMGGQTDDNDFHKSTFDKPTLTQMFTECGLVLLRPWTSEIDDCAAYDISLNLEGRKPHFPTLSVGGAMSVPRLGFMDNQFCCIEAVLACNVKLSKNGGAFWGQAMTNALEKIVREDNPDCILTGDYDSAFMPKDLATMMQLMSVYPEIDALAPIQSSRHLTTTLFTVRGENGNEPIVKRADLAGDTMKVNTAHFGLTLIRTEKLRQLPKPWFHSVPSPTGEWHDGDGHIDEDINFWRNWEDAGFSLHLACRVVIGHMELMVRVPDENLEVMYVTIDEWRKSGGKPEGIWR